MDLHDTVIHLGSSSTFCQDNGLWKVWSFTSSLRVYSNHTKGIPDFLEKNIETKLHVNRNASCKWILRDFIDLLYRNLINFVVNIQAFNVFSVALNNINKFIDIIVASESNVSIMNFVLVQNILNQFFITTFCQFNLSVELDSTGFCLLDRNIWLLLVESDSNLLEFLGKFFLLGFTFLTIEDHENDICGFTNSDYLFTSTLTVGSTFDNTRKIEQLHFSLVDKEDTWDTRQGCELVCSGLTCGTAQLIKKWGFTYRWKTNHNTSCISIFFNVETFTFWALLWSFLLKLSLEFGKTSFQLSPMVLSCLIFLSFSHLIFNILNFVTNSHFYIVFL